jgi:hypothetical protein
VPCNSSATVMLPARGASRVQESGTPAASAPGLTILKSDSSGTMVKVESGDYNFSVA